FIQAEDGIRDSSVTGVQTCALPILAWTNVPDGAASFAILMHDVDAATGNGTDDILHWLLWNIPASTRGLAEGIAQGSQLPDGTRDRKSVVRERVQATVVAVAYRDV